MRCEACGTDNEKGQEYCVYCGASLEKEGKGLIIGLIVGIAVIIIACVTIGLVVFFGGNSQGKYDEFISEGAKYLAEMDYEQAIVQYEDAIDLDPDNEEAYTGLANTYMAMGEYTLAEVAILDGISMTNSSNLVSLLTELSNMIEMNDSALLNREEDLAVVEVSNVTLNSSIFTVVGSSTYNDYARDYGSGAADYNSSTGIVEVTYSGFDGICSYYDTSSDTYIVDEKSELPYSNKSPNEVTFASINSIFTNVDGVITQEKLEEITGVQSTLSYNDAMGINVVSLVYGRCQLLIETDADGSIVSSNAWNQLIPLEVSAAETSEDMGSLSGTVINAVTGSGTQATIIIHEGHNEKGDVIDEIDTNSRGEYLFEYVDGEYTFEIESSGFITEFFEVEIKNEKDVDDEDFTISPELEDGEIRVVLEWGATPTDLDTHVSGTSSNGKNFYIHFGNKTYYESGESVAVLDVDDTNGYGPETFTLSDTGAEFSYWIEDYTTSGTMSTSGATVKVYLPNESSPQIYNVPSGVDNIWEVFSYEDGKLTAGN